jgi:hypothetical protein
VSERHRLSDLIGMTVSFAGGREDRHVLDVRLVPSERVPGPLAELRAAGLVVGRRRPGTLLGYDRNPQQGPWLIRTIVRWIHRDSGYVEWSEVESVDWDARVVRARVERPSEL